MLSDEEKHAIEFVKSELQDEKIARNDYQSLTGLYGNLEIETVLNLIDKQSKEIEELKASHIMTHNKSTNTEKAKIFDVIDNSLDRYIEKKFPVTITKEELEKRWGE